MYAPIPCWSGVWHPSMQLWPQGGVSHHTEVAIPCGIGTRVHSSQELLVSMLRSVEAHGPVWLVGHNCVMFDNQFFAYHLPHTMAERYVRPVRLTNTYDSKFCFLLDIPGVNNADTYVYLDSTSRSQFKSLSLALAEELELGRKLYMPGQEGGEDGKRLIEYCINDSVESLLREGPTSQQPFPQAFSSSPYQCS